MGNRHPYLDEEANKILLVLVTENTGAMASSLHPPRNLRKRRSTSAIREAQESQKKIETTTQPTTTTDALTITEAVTEAAFDAAINTTNDIIEAAQGASTNTPNAALGTVMIEADTTITAANKETLLKHLRKPKEHFVPKSIRTHFYAHCCSCGQEKKTNREGTKCRNCRHERCL